MKKGKFIISIDFELHWGGAEKWDLNNKKQYFIDTRESIPHVLELFDKYEIAATWATVGFLFGKNKSQLLNLAPELQPSYFKQELSYYSVLSDVGENESIDPFHFAPSLIDLIIATPRQELASHTFCHYYALEEGQSLEEFSADLLSAQRIAKENFNYELKSLVFPRNQYNVKYLAVAKDCGFKVVRSNPDVWFWKMKEGKITSILRAIDTLFPISKSLSYLNNNLTYREGVCSLPASRFFRSYKNNEKLIQPLKIRRIKSEMSYAAKNGLNYHLWWHPHNFADNVTENLIQLEELLKHYKKLNEDFSFSSITMLESISKQDT